MIVQTGDRAKLPISRSKASKPAEIANEDGKHNAARANPLVDLHTRHIAGMSVSKSISHIKCAFVTVRKGTVWSVEDQNGGAGSLTFTRPEQS